MLLNLVEIRADNVQRLMSHAIRSPSDLTDNVSRVGEDVSWTANSTNLFETGRTGQFPDS
jgi:hypothetical protein